MRSTRGARRTSVVVTAVLGAVSFLCGCESTVWGCPALGIVVSQEVFDDGTYLATLDREPAQVWPRTVRALRRGWPESTELQDRMREAVTEIDDARVTVRVETWKRGFSTLRVSPLEYGVGDRELASRIYDEIMNELEQ